jgi:L,D-transpeptidase YcbB
MDRTYLFGLFQTDGWAFDQPAQLPGVYMLIRFRLSRTFVLALSAGVLWAGAPQAQSPGIVASGGAALALKTALPQMSGYRQGLIAEAAQDPAILEFYRARDFAAFWTAPEGAVYLGLLLAALETADLHGLPVRRYDAAGLRETISGLRSQGDLGRFEVQLTRALLDFARDMTGGALDPKKIDAGIVRDVPKRDRANDLVEFLADPEGFLHGLAPRDPEYARLLRARAQLRAQIADGGWGPRVTARSLKVGASGASVVELRNRLVRMGYLGRTATQTFDATIQAAVQGFQADHGLPVTGQADEATISQINVAPETRMRSVLVAMERERWSNIERGVRHIWVNLTDFTAKIIDDGKVTFETRAVVGSTVEDKRTPEFSHFMTYMEINPDWTVPPGIIRRDYLPKLRANPGALAHLQVVDSRGRVVPRSQVNFAAYSEKNFPFNLRQPPGRSNALGQVKFMFPNPWSIYLHDTPDKHLFARDTRAYSSGCVRLNDPFDFAYTLLAPQTDDPKGLFHRVLDSGRQERVTLATPVPVHIEYRTAFSNTRGRLQFRSDIYGRDARIYTALRDAGVSEN